jgi:predicted patatin/cPLA2 family phospholipase
LTLDLKSKVDTLSTELDNILQNQNYDQRKYKESEKKLIELETQLETKNKMYNEIEQEFHTIENKFREFEENEQHHLEIVWFFITHQN